MATPISPLAWPGGGSARSRCGGSRVRGPPRAPSPAESGRTLAPPARVRDTVIGLTPACRATSLTVGCLPGWADTGHVFLSRRRRTHRIPRRGAGRGSRSGGGYARSALCYAPVLGNVNRNGAHRASVPYRQCCRGGAQQHASANPSPIRTDRARLGRGRARPRGVIRAAVRGRGPTCADISASVDTELRDRFGDYGDTAGRWTGADSATASSCRMGEPRGSTRTPSSGRWTRPTAAHSTRRSSTTRSTSTTTA